MDCEMLKGILRRIILLTQHHDADEVADDSEAACDDGEGPTDDWDDIVIIRSLVIFPTCLLDEFYVFTSKWIRISWWNNLVYEFTVNGVIKVGNKSLSDF